MIKQTFVKHAYIKSSTPVAAVMLRGTYPLELNKQQTFKHFPEGYEYINKHLYRIHSLVDMDYINGGGMLSEIMGEN